MAPKKSTERNWTEGTRARPHHRNDVWQLAKSLSLDLYRVTAAFPEDEKYGLVSQIRRAGVSIPSHIAEGKGRRTDPDFLRYLYMARGSLHEVDSQMELADELGYLDGTDVTRTLDLIENLTPGLQGLIDSVEQAVSSSC